MTRIALLIISILPLSVLAADGGVMGGGVKIVADKQSAGGIEDLNADRTNQEMVITTLNATQAVFDKSKATANTLKMPYADNVTYKIRAREFMGTMIVLPEGDSIQSHKLGDEINFAFKTNSDPLDENLPRTGSVDVNMPGADTVLNIIGSSGNIYTFYVRGDTWDSPYDPTLKIYITDEHLRQKLEAKERRAKAIEEAETRAQEEMEAVNVKAVKENMQDDYLETVAFNPDNLDFGYRIIGGDESIRPFMVYDDSTFTYFRFARHNTTSAVNSMPAVYRVADGSDVPTNASANKATLRVEGVANRWTLRLGEKWICIERMIQLPSNDSSMNEVIDTVATDTTGGL
ncbi:TrbG/VirB9 family P-type conjugative transfer protein [Enterovibrio paralichthyis]|uniref:TrbG/VirB9 family P-type conjugative transfer protein n=1 Tax=Enterovibrio paralichthyis TaxID=2853805 RepID=UPI001C46E761|nr:TrbG/VirB9 family P-type conjugative transfer protein [Enterovibrio paralichthyis]MBV7300746.1 TrbG/VirB9 family P-type conjugative transfer protein [Enterovibrio paralichthyis]